MPRFPDQFLKICFHTFGRSKEPKFCRNMYRDQEFGLFTKQGVTTIVYLLWKMLEKP